MAATRPKPHRFSTIAFLAGDVARELRDVGRPRPPGPRGLDMRRTLAMTENPLPELLDGYERYGPVFELRIFHHRMTFLVGAAATSFALTEHPELFHWREGHFGQLIPLIGDGILTTDEDYHDRARRLMMPAFHRRSIDTVVDVMVGEAAQRSAPWRAGDRVDVYAWARETALRVAMRALLGLDPDAAGSAAVAAREFERALHFYGTNFAVRLARGPGTPFAALLAARRRLDAIILPVVAERRRSRSFVGRGDVLSRLLTASDDDPDGFTDEEIRDQLLTLMFAGHDTSTAALAFLLHELVRHPGVLAAVRAELPSRPPAAEHLDGTAQPALERAIEETLRKWPPVWIGARRAVADVEVCGVPVPRGSYVQLGYWATHMLPELWPEPERFDPARHTREAKAGRPRHAYTPFGGGSRICIGKRFGLTNVRAMATVLLQRFDFAEPPGYRMRVRQEPTLSPRGGLPLLVRPAAGRLPPSRRG